MFETMNLCRIVAKCLYKLLVSFICFVGTVILLPFIFLLIVIPFYIYQSFVQIIAFIFKYHELDSILSAKDHIALLYDDKLMEFGTKQSMFVIPITIILEGKNFDFQRFKSEVKEKLLDKLEYKKLQQYPSPFLGFGFFKWDKDFLFEKHVHVLPNNSINQGNINEFLSSTLQNPFPEKSSPWEIHICQEFNGEDQTLLYLRFHHSLCDGYSVLKVLYQIMGLKPDNTQFINLLPSERPWFKTLVENLMSTIQLPYLFIQQATSSLSIQWKTINATENVFISTTRDIPLELFKETKKRLGVPFTGIVLTAFGKALTDHWSKYSKKVPRNIYGYHAVPLPGHPENTLVNWFSIVPLTIPLWNTIQFNENEIKEKQEWKQVPDLLTHLHLAKTKFRESTKIKFGETTHFLSYICGLVPIPITKIITKLKTTFVLSNIPGPTQEVQLFDQPVADFMFWIPSTKSYEITLSILSYKNNIRLGILANSNHFKSQEQLYVLVQSIQSNLYEIFSLYDV